MIKSKIFTCSPFQVNTYLIYDANGDCVIVDPSFYSNEEKRAFKLFIDEHNLKPVQLINTHGHVDHLLGNAFVYEIYGLEPLIHKEDLFIYNSAMEMGAVFGLDVQQPPSPKSFLNENDIINFGDSKLTVLHLPGHSPGSIALFSQNDKVVFSGDVLFYGSIGRTDLPQGNYDTLISQIKNKLLVLDEDVTVYPGHGPETTIKQEKDSNPFLK